jgi:hypothetical protein
VSPDQAALRILLAPGLTARERQARLGRLAREVRAVVECRVECPECGHQGPHEHNGDRHDPLLCCVECGTHFSEPEVRL